MSTADAALESARRGFLKLALSAPLQRGAVDLMLTASARAVEGLSAALDGDDADELAEQVARVRKVAELWAGVVSALAAVDAAPVLCAPCAASQVAEPVTLPLRAPAGDCARCGEVLPAPEPAGKICSGCDDRPGAVCITCGRGTMPGAPVPSSLPASFPLLAAEQAALAGMVLWSEARESESATVEQVAAAEQRLSLLAGVVRKLRAESPRVRP